MEDRVSEPEEIIVDVSGMTCTSCEPSVVKALESVPGVRRASASFGDSIARVTADGAVAPKAVVAALENAGYGGTVRVRASQPAAADRTGAGDYDLVVLGGGSAGFAAAIKVAESGGRVALINAGTLGGTCVNVGCIPSKALIRAAEANHRRRHHPFNGIPSGNGAVDWSAVRDQKDALVAGLRQAKYRDVLAAYPSVTLFEERGTVASDGSVRLASGIVVKGKGLVVTTGSSPKVPPIPGLEDAGYLTSTTLMELEALPDSLIVIGASIIAMELGQAYFRLGVKVSVMTRRSAVLPHEDLAIGQALTGYAREEGMEIITGVSYQRVDRDGRYTVHFTRDGQTQAVSAEQLLIATGRQPNTSGFGLEEAGVELGPGGEIVVDDHLRTGNSAIYAAGDVTGEPMYVYVAAYAGSLAADNVMGPQKTYDLSALPKVTFTDPSVAAVGLSEAEAREQGYNVITSTLPLEYVPRSQAAHDTRGFVKLVADGATRRILGAHILASEAGEMIMEPTLAIKFGLTIEDITSTFHPYLTLSEGIKLAAQTFDKDVAQLSCCAA